MYILLGLTALVILTALLFLLRVPVSDHQPAAAPPAAALPGMTHCPLCGTSLSGTRLYAKQLTYPDKRVMLEIRGCGHCYKEGHVFDRSCPRCQKRLGVDDAVMATSRTMGTVVKVHILGCPSCNRR